jgi:hypothetical protein
MDLIYIAGIALFLAVTVGLAAGCEKLGNRTPGGRP